MSWFKKISSAVRGSEDFSDIKSSSIRDVLNGEIFSKNFFKKQYGLIIMISILAFMYVDNRYTCENQMAKEVEMKKKIQDLKYESITISAELMSISRQSSVVNLVKENGLDLKVMTTPPIVIADSIQE